MISVRPWKKIWECKGKTSIQIHSDQISSLSMVVVGAIDKAEMWICVLYEKGRYRGGIWHFVQLCCIHCCDVCCHLFKQLNLLTPWDSTHSTIRIQRIAPFTFLKRTVSHWLGRLEWDSHSLVQSHYCLMWPVWVALCPTWPGSWLIKPPGHLLLPGGGHVDRRLSADTGSTWPASSGGSHPTTIHSPSSPVAESQECATTPSWGKCQHFRGTL